MAPSSVSRRDFWKGAGVTGGVPAATAVATDVEAQTGPRAFGPGDVPVTLTVNGKRLELRIEPRVTLLDAIRNRADLTDFIVHAPQRPRSQTRLLLARSVRMLRIEPRVSLHQPQPTLADLTGYI